MTAESKTTPSVKKTPVPKRIAAKKGTRLTETEKAEAIALWENGDITLEGLSAKFGRSKNTFVNLFNTEQVMRGSKRAEAARTATEAVNNATIQATAEYSRRVKEVKERRYTINNGLDKLASSLIAQARAEGKDIGTQLASIKTLREYATLLRMTFEERYTALGINPNDAGEERPMPELVIQELTAEQIEEMIANSRVGSEDGFNDDGLMGDETLFDSGSASDRVETE